MSQCCQCGIRLRSTYPAIATLVGMLLLSAASFGQTRISGYTFCMKIGSEVVQIRNYYGGEPVTNFKAGVLTQPSGLIRWTPASEAPLPAEIVIEYSPVSGSQFNGYLTQTLAGVPAKVNATLSTLDGSYREVQRLELQNATIVEVEFSELDLTLSDQTPVIRVRLRTDNSAVLEGSKQPIQFTAIGKAVSTKASYSLAVTDSSLQNAFTQAARVEPINFVSEPSGEWEDTRVLANPSGLGTKRFSEIVVFVPEQSAAALRGWQSQQTAANPQRKDGVLNLLTTDRSKVVAGLSLKNLNIVSVSRIAERPGYVKVRLLCESIDFSVK